MASSYSDLGIELMATGENAGTWGTKTNTNLQIVEKSIAGYVEKAITSGGTTALTITDGDATESTSVARHAVIKLTGTITGNSIVTVPDSIEKVYIVVNGTSGAYTVQFKTASGSGITFGTTDKGTRLLFSDGTNIVDTGFSTSVAADDISTGDAAVTIATSSGDITVDGPSDIILDADGGDIFFKDGGTTFGSATNTSGNLIIKSGTTTAVTFSGANATVAGNLSVGGDFDVTGSLDFSDANITNVGSIALDTITNDGTDITLDSSGDIILDADGANVTIKDGGTSILDIANSSSDVELTVSVADKNFKIKGTDGASAITALDIDMALEGKATFNGDVVVTGDLTVSGDDITMGTNTSGNLLIADGTNFNSVAVGSLSEISTVADDDVFLAVDTSGGGLKKIARSAVVSGLATSSAISNVADDSTPQLGGNLDMNGNDIVTTSNADLELAPNGTGHVTVKGNTNSGAIQFNCESNSHGQQIKAQPHSAGVTNVMLLPDGADSTLVSLVATQTLTNKTLTTPVIAEIDSGSTITLDATTDIILDADGANITLKDGGTTVLDFVLNGATDVTLDAPGDIKFDADGGDFNFLDGGTEILRISNSSSDVIIKPIVDAKDLIFQQRDGTEVARIEDNGTFNVVTAKLAINGTAVTSTAAELNLLDGVSGLVQADLTKLAAVDSTAAELNIVDGGTSATSTTLVDADRLVANDNGTMVQVAMSDVKTYLSSAGFSTDDPTALAIALG